MCGIILYPFICVHLRFRRWFYALENRLLKEPEWMWGIILYHFIFVHLRFR
jgi:hypothetical protein